MVCASGFLMLVKVVLYTTITMAVAIATVQTMYASCGIAEQYTSYSLAWPDPN